MKANAANVLVSMTGVSKQQLLQQAEKLVAGGQAGGVGSLSSLDVALAAATTTAAQTERNFATMTQTRATETHLIESPEAAFARVAEAPGFKASTPTSAPSTPGAMAQLGQGAVDRMKGSTMFTAQGLMDGGLGNAFNQVVSEVGNKIKDYETNKGNMDEDSRQLQFEKLKNDMQKITQLTNTLTNVLKTMHDGAMSAIRNIRG